VIPTEETEAMDAITTFLSDVNWGPLVRAAAILLGSVLAAYVVRAVVFRLLARATARTGTDLDDILIANLRRPIVSAIVLSGVGAAFLSLEPPAGVRFVGLGIVKTLAIFVVAGALMGIGGIFLELTSRSIDRWQWVQPKTLPILRILLKVLVFGGALYFLLISWGVNPASWVASAGVLGLAIGFAAKDTLANLFAGIFILADTPYKIGDFVILQNGVRGQVTDIGVRSSRILTRDDVEVTVPNAVIAAGDIINESSGPYPKMRVRVQVEAAYGSDVDQVRAVLMSCVEGVPQLCGEPEPRVRFRAFGASGLQFELLAWIDEPVFRGRVLDILNERVYKAFGRAGIEIPYAKRDVYVKEWPAGTAPGSPRGE
jgi:MscS family membrane protein